MAQSTNIDLLAAASYSLAWPQNSLAWPQGGPPVLRAGRAHEATGASARAFAAALIGARAGAAVWVRSAAFPEGLDPHGLAPFFDPARLTLAAAHRPEDALWAMEECLRSGAAPTVVAEYGGRLSLTASRRLQLAAEAGGGVGLVLSPEAAAAGRSASAAETRWRISPAPIPRAARPGSAGADDPSPPCWRWELLKNKRGPLGAWTIALTSVAAAHRPQAPGSSALTAQSAAA